MSSILPDDALALHLAGGTAEQLLRLRRHLGGARRWLARGAGAWCRVGLGAPAARRLGRTATPEALAEERRRVAKVGARLVGLLGPETPPRLATLRRPPIALAVRGRWPPPQRALAIVGARAATGSGRRVAERFGAHAARCGHAVVSGLARGVDRAALEGCLASGGWPVAVLGNGLDQVYPPENVELQEDIAKRGTLISEFPMGTRPDRWTFPRRNRILAALGEAVLVVEASRRSGSLITADFALELGLEVFTVPGPIDGPAWAGSNRLLEDGAAPVLDEASLARLLGAEACPRSEAAGDSAHHRGSRADDPILGVLAEGPCAVDELCRRLAWPAARVRPRLIDLELAGLARRLPSDRWCERAPG